MTTHHTISTADMFYRGNARNPGANADGRRGTVISNLYKVNFGAVATLDADGIAVAQAAAGAGNLTINGALATGGVATMDVPRCVQAVSTGAGDTSQTLTFTGTDEYGHTMVETITLNGVTPVNGAKAFKTVTQVAISAAAAGNVSAGSNDVLGLPYAIAALSDVVQTTADGVVDAPTIVVADTTNPATATDGDVRGTIDFTTASNGTVLFSAVIEVDASTDALAYGVPQFAG